MTAQSEPLPSADSWLSPRPNAVLQVSGFLAISAAALAGLAGALRLLPYYDPPYVPYDGIVGAPAFLDYSPTKKLVGYVAMVLASTLAGLGGFGLWTLLRSRLSRGAPVVLGICAVLFASSAHLVFLCLPPQMRELLWESRRSVPFWAFLLGAAVLGCWLAIRPSSPRSAPRSPPPTWSPVLLFSWACIVGLQIWAWSECLAPILGQTLARLAIFPILSICAFTMLIVRRGPSGKSVLSSAESDPEPADRRSSIAQGAEVVAWWGLAALVLIGIPLRFLRSIGVGEDQLAGLLVAAFGLFAPIYLISTTRWMLGARSRVSPLIFLPFTAAALYRGAGTVVTAYDPFHQGEYIYAAKAMGQGLAPFRDIFFVHGLGFNAIAGWAMRPWLHDVPNLDIYFLSLLSTLGVGLMCWFYLRMWGERWWLLAFAMAAITAGAASTKGARFLPVYLTLLLIGRYLCGGRDGERTGWLVLAGAISAAGVFFSLDTGVLAVAAGLGWGAIWSWRTRSWTPVVSFAAGVAAAWCAGAAWLASAGILDDFLALHWDYVRFKPHYDNLPMVTTGLAYFISPLALVLALVTLIPSLLKRTVDETDPPRKQLFERASDTALFGILIFLALANFGAFLRGLDRSDEGHLIYGSVMAWPLLGCLVVWRAGPAISGLQALIRSAGFAGLLAALPFVPVAIRGTELPVVPAHRLFTQYVRYIGEPAMPRTEDMETDFFGLCAELNSATSPGEFLLDMTGQPALYFWTDLRCPTRFYSSFYPSSLTWQNEVIGRLESTQTPWVLWPGPEAWGARFDGIDIQLRQHAIVAYLAGRYRPELAFSDGSTLLARIPEGPVPPEPWLGFLVDIPGEINSGD